MFVDRLDVPSREILVVYQVLQSFNIWDVTGYKVSPVQVNILLYSPCGLTLSGIKLEISTWEVNFSIHVPH